MNDVAPRFAQRIRIKEAPLRLRMMEMAAGLKDVITLGRGDPDLPTPRARRTTRTRADCRSCGRRSPRA
jgi:hypothetical protein